MADLPPIEPSDHIAGPVISRDRLGHFRPGVSGNPAGNKRGNRLRSTLFAEKLLAGESAGLVRKVIELAKGGDVAALKLCIDRILPVPKSRPVKFRLPEVRTVTDASNALSELIKGLSSGKLLPEDAEALASPITALIKAIEVAEIDGRISALEAANAIDQPEAHYNA